MASITVSYLAVTGNVFAASDFNNIWSGATITLGNGEVTTLKILDDAVTRDKIASNVAGAGLVQNGDGSLSPVAAAPGVKGYTTQAVAGADITLTSGTSNINQRFTGSTSGAMSIVASLTAATAGDDLFLIFSSVTTTPTFTLTIKSDTTALFVFDDTGTIDGMMILSYTGTAWFIKLNVTTIRP